jgi:hypothetical protein
VDSGSVDVGASLSVGTSVGCVPADTADVRGAAADFDVLFLPPDEPFLDPDPAPVSTFSDCPLMLAMLTAAIV